MSHMLSTEGGGWMLPLSFLCSHKQPKVITKIINLMDATFDIDWYLSIAIGCDLLSEICFQAMVVLCEKDTL